MNPPFMLSVATFGRVFDVHPAVDALTLEELSQALSRFQLKTELLRREERDLDRAKKAVEAVVRGETTTGPMGKRIERHLGRHAGEANAPEQALADLEKDIRREAKQDLRLWAPTLFVPGARREDENVVHLSALVLDFDKGPGPDALREIFADVFHIAHSTWSHTTEKPKLRLVLPLSAAVAPADYDAIWHHADERAGKVADPTGRALARAWALPAVPRPDRDRIAWTHPGPLFDPFALGLARAPERTPTPSPTHASFLRPDPAETFLPPTGSPEPPAVATETEPSATFDPWDGGGAAPSARDLLSTDDAAPTPTPAPAPTPTSSLASLQATVDALEARVVTLEKVLSDYL